MTLFGLHGPTWLAWSLVLLVGCGRVAYDPVGAQGTLDDAGTPDAPFASSTWSFRKRITVASALTSSTLTDFPLLVSVTDMDLATKARADGADLAFFAEDEITPLHFELQRWNGGALIAWVNIPTLSASSDTEIYLYYGNHNATSSASDGPRTWPTYKGVWHLDEEPGASQIYDSSAQQMHGTVTNGDSGSPISTIGIVGNAVKLDGVDDYLDMGTNSPVQDFVFTLSAWINGEGANSRYVLDYSNNVVNPAKISLSLDNGLARIKVRDELNVEVEVANGQDLRGAWHHIAGTSDGSTARLYVDGSIIGMVSLAGMGTIATSIVSIARHESIPECCWFGGEIDEVRYQPTGQSGAWIAAEFQNQSDPATYLQLGKEEILP